MKSIRNTIVKLEIDYESLETFNINRSWRGTTAIIYYEDGSTEATNDMSRILFLMQQNLYLAYKAGGRNHSYRILEHGVKQGFGYRPSTLENA